MPADHAAPMLNVGRPGVENLRPIRDPERARELGRKGAAARARKRAEGEAAQATIDAVRRGEQVEVGAPARMKPGPMRTTLNKVCEQISKDAPWSYGDKAAAFLAQLHQLAMLEDQAAEARRQRLLVEAVRKEPSSPAPDAVAALAAALAAASPPVGASEPEARADDGPGDGAEGPTTAG